jgi:aldehyde dehydrogenase (NAD+)
MDLDAIWYFGSSGLTGEIERASATNLKRAWANHGLARDWFGIEQGEGRGFLRQATEVKNVWIPYGE